MTYHAQIEMMPVRSRRPEWSFYLGWVALTSLCVPIAFALSLMILKMITAMIGDFVYVNGVQHITEDYLAMYVFVPMVSLLTGALQYVLLRPYLGHMGWWVLATVAGWHLGILLIAVPGWLGWVGAPLNNLKLIFLLMGLSIGAVQWLVLRRRLARAAWWIAANVLGWALLAAITRGTSLNQYGLLTLGFLPGCTTAGMLAWYMNRTPQS